MRTKFLESAAAGTLALIAAGCLTPLDSNASDPPNNPSRFIRSESSIAHLPYEVTEGGGTVIQDRLILAYNDQSGFFDFDSSGHLTITRPRPTFAGLSLSKNAGETWQRLPPLPPPATCPGAPAPCIRAVSSDPWVSASGGIALYTIMASTAVSEGAIDVIGRAISLDGESWSDVEPAVFRSGHSLDKPSHARFGAAAVLAFLDFSGPGGLARMSFADSSDHGVSWADESTVGVPLVGSASTSVLQNPVVKLRLSGRFDGSAAA